MSTEGSNDEDIIQAGTAPASNPDAATDSVVVEATAEVNDSNSGGGRDEDWHFLERPATPHEGGDAAIAGRARASGGRSRASDHSFEHLSDHFGALSGPASPTNRGGSRSSFDGLSGGDTSADDMLAGVAAGRRGGGGPAADVIAIDPEVAATVHAAINAVVAAAEPALPVPAIDAAASQDPKPVHDAHATPEESAAEAAADSVTNDVVDEVEAASPTISAPDSSSATPLGSSYADLAAAADLEDLVDDGGVAAVDGEQPTPQALDQEDAAIASAETSEGTPASTTDGGSETTDSDGGGAGYMAMLRAALARAAPPTAVATVMAWLQEWVAPLQRMLPSRRLLSSLAAGGAAHLEALSRAALARLRAALAGAVDVLTLLDRSAVVLGASGIGFAVLGALLYSSRAEIRRLRTQLVTKDQDLALLAAKIFKLNETIRAPAHRIPIIHHATVAMFPAYPSLDVL